MKCTVLCALICLTAACAGTALTEITSSVLAFNADGVSGGVVEYRFASGGIISNPADDASGALRITAREKEGHVEKIYFKSSGKPGRVRFTSSDGAQLQIVFREGALDADADGFPDAAELTSEEDRAAFASWFVRTAESQFLKRSSAWNANERDCAGLIRYCYREALKKHDDLWLKRSGIVLDKNLPDVGRFNYPAVPVIGERLFKIKKGPADNLSTFGSFADASILLSHNLIFVSKKLDDARAGDLIMFQLDSSLSPWHSMIVASAGSDPVFIYHTGRDDVVKRVTMQYLKGSGAFEPAASNRRFLGVYRFSILE